MSSAPLRVVPGDVFSVGADRIVAATGARTVLDLGHGGAPLAEALRDRGRDVRSWEPELLGSGLSETSVDLITCIDVVRHLDPVGAQVVVDEICGATDRVLFSARPLDAGDEVPLHEVDTWVQWAAWFAERGFLRRTDLDLTMIGQAVVLFQRADGATVRDVVERYESRLVPLVADVLRLRVCADSARSESARNQTYREVAAADRSLLERHAALVARENVIGLEAQVARLQADLEKARANVRRLRERARAAEQEVAALRTSRTWRIGRALTAPLRKLLV